jgi:DUF177 domain-containing protein
MAILINLRHLETKSQRLEGECAVSELDLENGDELISLHEPLQYELEAQLMERAILVQGRLEVALDCECARCLKPFRHVLKIDDWACHIPLDGEEKALVINDCVDLTPYIREDIFLAFPQRPLCDANCSGLKTPAKKSEPGPAASGEAMGDSSPWSVLDKLKL